MKKVKRKPRLKVEKKEIDFSIPLLDLGSESDPCFGKLHSLEAPECQECGDCQACQIMMANKLHSKREKMHSKNAFMDLEETNVIKLSILEAFLVSLVSNDKVVSVKKAIDLVDTRFNSEKRFSNTDIVKNIKLAVKKSVRLKSFVNDTGKRYLTLIKK